MSAIKKLADGIVDIANMRVQTFTGTLTAQIDGAQGNIQDWNLLLEQAKNKGEVSLAMDTSMDIDGDTLLFIADGLSADVKAMHTNAVEGARAYRSGIVEAFADLLGMK
jgi:hypothetical protein